MSYRSKRRKSTRRNSGFPTFSVSSIGSSQPILVTATDLCLWLTVVAVAIGFGGRMANGQLALVAGVSATAFCWLLHLLTSSSPRYFWSGSEWLWGLGIAIGVAQLVPLPDHLLLTISPRLKQVLPLWFDPDFQQLIPATWNQLSLAPWETASGLATFVSYAVLFLVAVQRIRTIADVERTLCGVGLTTVAMMLFAQAQFLTSNGKFFWVYEHPYMTTDSYPLGCFTNRNHLAQFLALGAAPMIWWLLRRLHQQECDRAERHSMPPAMHALGVSLLLIGLGGIGLTIFMTLSRGGLLAIAITSILAVVLMSRIGLASMKFGLALMIVGVVTSSLLSMSKYESVLANRLEQKSGRHDIWMANWLVAKDFPVLGTGVGTHADAYHIRFDSKDDDDFEYSHAECGYLQIASESGLAGLLVTILFIATGFRWCIGSLWNPDAKVSSAAAAILASLSANVAHAAVDFFWYTPVCILMLSIQLACAARLFRLTRQAVQIHPFSFPLPRYLTLATMCGLVATTVWMWDLKYPAALAEPHRIQSILLAHADERDVTDEEKASTNRERLKEMLLAAKYDRRDAKLQEGAATAYMQFFEMKQEHSENTMSASMLRDAAKSSKFDSFKAKLDWLDRAVGPNLNYLRIATRSLRKALQNCPLRARSYVLLTELIYLERDDDADFQSRCLNQSLTLRPRDSETLYLIGKSALQQGNLEQTLEYWRPAFRRNRTIQERISEILVGQMPPDFFESEFHPDWKALDVISKAYSKVGLVDESERVQRWMVKRGLARAKIVKSDIEFETMLLSMANSCREAGHREAAAEVLTQAVIRLPHNYTIRYMLGLDLLEDKRPAEAAEHLTWCAQREPGNELLQKMATKAIAERHKQLSSNAHRDQNVEPAGFRN